MAGDSFLAELLQARTGSSRMIEVIFLIIVFFLKLNQSVINFFNLTQGLATGENINKVIWPIKALNLSTAEA